MSKRVSRAIRQFDTESAQGEGSWVKLRSLTMGEIRGLRKLRDDEDFDPVEGMADLIVDHLVEWNWVDDDGEPLPATEAGCDQLRLDEAELLATLLVDTDTKESKK